MLASKGGGRSAFVTVMLLPHSTAPTVLPRSAFLCFALTGAASMQFPFKSLLPQNILPAGWWSQQLFLVSLILVSLQRYDKQCHRHGQIFDNLDENEDDVCGSNFYNSPSCLWEQLLQLVVIAIIIIIITIIIIMFVGATVTAWLLLPW